MGFPALPLIRLPDVSTTARELPSPPCTCHSPARGTRTSQGFSGMGWNCSESGRWQENQGPEDPMGNDEESLRPVGILFSWPQWPKDHFITEVHGMERGTLREREDADTQNWVQSLAHYLNISTFNQVS